MTASGDALEYTSWPLRDDFPRSLALVAAIAGTAVAVGASFEGAEWAVASFVLLVLALGRYFVRTRYVLNSDGVRVRVLGRERFRPWSEVRAIYPHRDGVHLSPFASPSPLDPFRGMFVRFASNRQEVIEFCERHVRKA